MSITDKLLKERGFYKESDYKKVVDFMVRNNEENDIKNNKTDWKYFYNIGIQYLGPVENQVAHFCFIYNRKNCYYNFIQKTLKIVLSEDLKIEVQVDFEDLIEFLKSNNSLFEFDQKTKMYYTDDKIRYNSFILINH